MTTSNINRDAQLSTLANAAYLDTPPKTITTTGGTWAYVDQSKATNSGFFGVAYRNTQTGEIAIAYRGTNGLSDLKADTTFVTGGWSQQFTDAAKFTADVQNFVDRNYLGAKLLTTGHSLGDGIGQIMAQMFSLDGVGYEGPGSAKVVQNAQYAAVKAQYAPDTTGLIGAYTTYRAGGSVISGTGTHLGQVVNLVYLTEGGALGFTGAAIGIVGLATGGAGGILLGALGLAGSNVASKHSMDGMERSMYVKAGLENALARGALTMSYAPQSSATGQAWTGEGSEPQVIVFKNSNSQVAAYIQKQGDSWTLSTPDQSTRITLTPATSAGQAPQLQLRHILAPSHILREKYKASPQLPMFH